VTEPRWAIVTSTGEEGTGAAAVIRPCIVTLGRIIGSMDQLADAQLAADAVNDRRATGLPLGPDLRDTLCFVRRHGHVDTSYCLASREEADAIIAALAARYDYRAKGDG
jgi:hypothetical protein